MSGRTLAQLQGHCEHLGLSPTPTKTLKNGTPKFLKRDYIQALRRHFLSRLARVPEHLKAALQIESPMLCKRYSELKPEEQGEIWSDDNWIVEPKFDGLRMMVVFHPEEGVFFYDPRDLSPKNYFPVRHTQIHHGLDLPKTSQMLGSFVMDVEVTCESPVLRRILSKRGVPPETGAQAVSSLLALPDSIEVQKDGCPLSFQALDVLMFNSSWEVMDYPLSKRRSGLKTLCKVLRLGGMRVEPSDTYQGEEGKRRCLDSVISSGGEGVVAKRLDSPYNPATSRPKDGWIKIKQGTRKQTLRGSPLGDTLDGWVSGVDVGDDGMVSCVHISVEFRRFDGSSYNRVMAYVRDLPEALRAEMTIIGLDGEPGMAPQFEERVAEIDGEGFSPRNYRVRNPRLVRWRDDKYKELCVLEEESLRL